MNTLRLILAFILLFSVACKERKEKNFGILYEIELNSIKENLRNLPNLVAYGKYDLRIFLNSKEGYFKLYKLSDSIFINLDDSKRFLVSMDPITSADFGFREVQLKGDTFIVEGGKDFYAKIIADKLVEFKSQGIYLQLDDYIYEPVKIPRKWIIRYMGAIIILKIDSVKVIY